MHVKARSTVYPVRGDQEINRFPVPDDKVNKGQSSIGAVTICFEFKNEGREGILDTYKE